MSTGADLQTVLAQFLPRYRQAHALSPREAEVCTHLGLCRTAALGELPRRCDQCGYREPLYGSCRDRHCPKCQWRASQAWCAQQCQSVLPVTYYHLVFTVPHALNGWVALHPGVIYRLFFKVVWATLKAFGSDPKRLGGQLGATLVLHTWGQQLTRHVHIHCLVPGGALRADGQWQGARGSYLFPNRALARCVRGKLVSELRRAAQRGELYRVTRPGEVDELLDQLIGMDWVVYTKPWLKAPETVVAYLARYTHRIAISDARITTITERTVTISYKDYQDHDRWKTLSLAGEELIRRYLLHVLPKGLMRVRHYGFLSNRCRRQRLGEIRAALNQPPHSEPAPASVEPPGWPCPRCRHGRLRIVPPVLAKAPLSGPERLDGY